MPRTSHGFRRRIVSFAAILAFIVLYFCFMENSWAIYASICAGYTILVLGLLWSDGKWTRYIQKSLRTSRELLQGHLVFLLMIVLWIWLCRFARPLLPGWMFDFGFGELTLYLIFSGLGIVAIWWAEQSWLAKPPKRDEAIRFPTQK